MTTSAPQTLVLTGTVTSPNSVTNTATITAADQFDPNTGNNTASAVVTPQRADLALAKTVSNPTPNVGDTITYTVTLTNKGPDAATSVQVTDLLPAGVTFVSDTPSQGTYVAGTGLWTVGTVNVGTPQTLVILATVASSSPQTNTATITAADQFDPITRQQHRRRPRDAAARRPRPFQDRGRPHAQRRRHDHLHGHARQQRPE